MKTIKEFKTINNNSKINQEKDKEIGQKLYFNISLKKSIETPKEINNANNNSNIEQNKLSINQSYNNDLKKIKGSNKIINKKIRKKKI